METQSTDYVICTAITTWSDPEATILLQKVIEYTKEIGPMKKFRNKKAMWEKISTDILTELGSLKTAAQCENRYKTMRKRKGWVDFNTTEENLREKEPQNKASRPSKQKKVEENTDEASSNQIILEDAQTIDISKVHHQELSIEDPIAADEDVDVRRGVGQVTYSITCEQNDEERPGMSKKRRFRQTLSSVLLQIHREKEEARERRHQEKMELLKLLLQ